MHSRSRFYRAIIITMIRTCTIANNPQRGDLSSSQRGPLISIARPGKEGKPAFTCQRWPNDRPTGIFRGFRVIFHASRIWTTIFQAAIKLKFLTPSIRPASTDPDRSTLISASLFTSASLYILAPPLNFPTVFPAERNDESTRSSNDNNERTNQLAAKDCIKHGCAMREDGE